MLKIGEFSKLSRVSVRMLRHYDEIGLLKPAEIDRFTDYRYYRESPLPMDLVEDDPCLCAVTYLDGEYREENVKNCYPVKKK